MPTNTRRDFLAHGLAVSMVALPVAARAAGERLVFRSDPFTLGVASGFPAPDSLVLWTRLAPEPLAPNGGVQERVVPVDWELAADESFRRIVRSGRAYATADWGHSVHVEPADLEPARDYWYRFTAGGARSPVGRTRTAPAADASPREVRFAVASCQQYEHGYYVAYRHMLDDGLDFVMHVGDYIYEVSWGVDRLRSHGSGECHTLHDYRARYALYKQEPELRAAHAAYPWIVTWDDHEVDNDYAGDISERDDDPALFMARRAAAYQAYYENMPLPRAMVPANGLMRLYSQTTYGPLLSVKLLDERQYRSPQVCTALGRRGGTRADNCGDFDQPGRSLLGERQEKWLDERLALSKARWNVVAQGVPFNHVDEDPGPGNRYWTDNWNGYPASRARLLESFAARRTSNPVVLSGDIHAFLAGAVHAKPADLGTPVVATEFTTTSISSQPTPMKTIDTLLNGNPNVVYGSSERRGYTRIAVSPDRMQTDFIAMQNVTSRDAGRVVEKSFVVENGRPGPQPV